MLLGGQSMAAAPPQYTVDPHYTAKQYAFIRNELRHMGWICDDGSVLDWYCKSPDRLLVIGGYHQDVSQGRK